MNFQFIEKAILFLQLQVISVTVDDMVLVLHISFNIYWIFGFLVKGKIQLLLS